MTIIKCSTVELTKQEAESIYYNKQYIVTSTAIFQPFYSNAQKTIYFQKVSIIRGLAKRGRHYRLTAKEINHILGYQYLIEE